MKNIRRMTGFEFGRPPGGVIARVLPAIMLSAIVLSAIVLAASVQGCHHHARVVPATGPVARTTVLDMTPVQARQAMADGWAHIDVRTQAEFVDGHPEGAVNIPVMHRRADGSGLVRNFEFLSAVKARYAPGSRIVCGCRSGRRSSMAASILQDAGYRVANMVGGFSGRRNEAGELINVGWTDSSLPVAYGPGE